MVGEEYPKHRINAAQQAVAESEIATFQARKLQPRLQLNLALMAQIIRHLQHVSGVVMTFKCFLSSALHYHYYNRAERPLVPSPRPSSAEK
jgi:hypothetical protein